MKSNGVTDAKKKARGRLETADTKLSGALCHMGAETGDSNLQRQTNYAPLAFGRLNEMKLIGVSKVLADLGKANVDNGAPYGLTPDLLTEQGNAQDDFSKQLTCLPMPPATRCPM